MTGNHSDDQRLFISVSVSGLDSDVEDLDDYLDDLLPTLEATLKDELSVQDASARAYHGPIYASVDEYCPECDTRLSLSRPELDYENGAMTNATCRNSDCDWVGTGEYRLIDLLGPTGGAVSENRIAPSYFTYPD